MSVISQRAAQPHINLRKIFLFCVLGLQSKSKIHLERTKAVVYNVHKELFKMRFVISS